MPFQTAFAALGTPAAAIHCFSAMRPDDDRYCSLNLDEDEDMNARLLYLIAGWPVIDPYARYLFVKENNNSLLVDATNAY
ncbi:MAG: hypothetical protein V2B20_03410 [Pseudomonadota bacterium]